MSGRIKRAFGSLICIVAAAGILTGCVSTGGKTTDAPENLKKTVSDGRMLVPDITRDTLTLPQDASTSADESLKTPGKSTKNETKEQVDEKIIEGSLIDPAKYIPDPNARIKIVLDPGHGGVHAGASCDGIEEKDINLKVALMCRNYLVTHYSDVAVYMTRSIDRELSPTLKDDLEERANVAEHADADALISIHFNASENHDSSGSIVYVSKRDNVHEESALLGDQILGRLEDLGLESHGISIRDSNDLMDPDGNPYDYYAINRHCAKRDIPGIIVEHAYIDNLADRDFIDSDEDLRAIAEADALGIAAHFELTLY
ncbi:MAG: N-acetylmuramoyl-L-alanine amidase [Lachnospiraceae bacterium]|nr:N-acetylmuramoyl-L-alanine amidase [Lachnospiraceae bacterium]